MIFNLYFFTVETTWRGKLSKYEKESRALVNRLAHETLLRLEIEKDINQLKGEK